MNGGKPPDTISLGWPLDPFLNTAWKADDAGTHWAFNLPGKGPPALGNVVICGKAGSGKSTLALQMAVACTRAPNECSAVHISLEEPAEGTINKAKSFGWESAIHEVKHIHRVSETATPEELAKVLKAILLQPAPDCAVHEDKLLSTAQCPRRETHGTRLEGDGDGAVGPQVLAFSLAPPSLVSASDQGMVFRDRYRQMQRLLSAVEALNEGLKKAPDAKKAVNVRPVSLVSIDSLNVFGTQPFVREEVHRLFDLFRRHKIMGVFVVETGQETPFDSTMADVVINLTSEKDQGYRVRHLEIEKSRYHSHVYGQHTFKITGRKGSPGQSGPGTPDAIHAGRPWETGIIVMPSLAWYPDHTKRTPQEGADAGAAEPALFDMGARAFEQVLPELPRGSVVTIEGQRGTFKTTFAVNFLAAGLYRGESGLLVRLADREYFSPQKPTKGKEAATAQVGLSPTPRLIALDLSDEGQKWEHFSDKKFMWDWLRSGDVKEWSGHIKEFKANLNVWENKEYGSEKKGRMIEVNFPSGMITPEEVIHVIRNLLEHQNDWHPTAQAHRFRRVVLDDVSLIGVSYPLLRESRTAGKLFLPAFVHLMRNYGVDLVMTGTTGELEAANEAVHQAVSLASAVISCRHCDVFGDRYVVVRSGGLMVEGTRPAAAEGEACSLAVQWEPRRKPAHFYLDSEKLAGLVGFDSGEIRRPGLLMYVFTQYRPDPGRKRNAHERYNDSLETLIRSAFGRRLALLAEGGSRPPAPADEGPLGARRLEDVSIVPFDSAQSVPIHDSLPVRKGRPLDRTVLYTLDEFWTTPGPKGKEGEKEEDVWLTSGLPSPPPRKKGETKDDPENDPNSHFVAWERKGAKEDKEPSHREVVRPYYANVLLLAYREDLAGKVARPDLPETAWERRVLEVARKNHPLSDKVSDPAAPQSPDPKSWEEVESLARDLLAQGPAPAAGPQRAEGDPILPTRGFWFDRSADETLACALMDAIVAQDHEPEVADIRKAAEEAIVKRAKGTNTAPARKGQRNLCKTLFDEFQARITLLHGTKQSMAGQYSQLAALMRLCHMSKSDNEDEHLLPADACVYLCWHTQLRDLVEREPGLARRLNVCALPGGGFTGDWFAGIARGSVSVELGKEVLDRLCSPAEQHKRFTWGVGLPTQWAFYAQDLKNPEEGPRFRAWPRSVHVPVERILRIHLQALSRSFIGDYSRFRTALAIRARHLTPLITRWKEIPSDKEVQFEVGQALARLASQVKALRAAQAPV